VNKLSLRFSELGRREEAFAATGEAVEILASSGVFLHPLPTTCALWYRMTRNPKRRQVVNPTLRCSNRSPPSSMISTGRRDRT